MSQQRVAPGGSPQDPLIMSADRAWYNRMVAEQMRNCGDISDCPEGGSESGVGEHADVSDKASLRDGRDASDCTQAMQTSNSIEAYDIEAMQAGVLAALSRCPTLTSCSAEDCPGFREFADEPASRPISVFRAGPAAH